MLIRRDLWIYLIGTLIVVGAGIVSAQNYPSKHIRIVTVPAGGSLDFQTRIIAQAISGPLGQPVVVDNRPAGFIQGTIVANSSPDGYTLLSTSNDFWNGTLLEKPPYDVEKDFSPITLLSTQPSILVVHPAVAANSVKELIALAKARPGVLNYASSAAGTSSHFAGELFKALAGVNIVRIPYKGGGPAIAALLGGEVQVAFPTAGAAAPHLKSGKLRPLAVTGAQRSALAPDLPTMAASGLPGYELDASNGIFAPAKTPVTIIKRLTQEIVLMLAQPDVKAQFFNAGTDVVGSSPQQLAAKVKGDLARLGKVVKDAGIKAE